MKKISILFFVILFATACNKTSNFVEITTNYGDIIIELYDETPLHRDNFQKLVKEGYYDNLLFHRVIKEFMIQGGDPDSKNADMDVRLGSGGPDYKIPAELNMSERCFHRKGALAAARKSDFNNPEQESSGSQFYIVVGRKFSKMEINQMEKDKISQATRHYFNLAYIEKEDTIETLFDEGKISEANALQQTMLDEVEKRIKKERSLHYMSKEKKNAYIEHGGTPHLDGTYTVFGQVIEGMDVIDRISQVETNNIDRPIKDIKMKIKFIKKT